MQICSLILYMLKGLNVSFKSNNCVYHTKCKLDLVCLISMTCTPFKPANCTIENRQMEMLQRFSYKYVAQPDPASPLKGKSLYVSTQYKLVGSWVKMGNILLYEKQ